ncbi:hypothetical protein [Nocardioides rubriscoriae]|uniref:hypothetical protein n=1 Tax=Nocardioides rubriscoriae TaxID=642762 RepID=UPI0011DF3E0E|nr:hypothetical protein [Nocardioides rubriscoriae]
MSLTPRRAGLVAPLLLVGLALNGCGVSDEQVRPGVAADVDGEQVSLSEVDESTTAVCDYLSSADLAEFSPFPRTYQRQGLATTRIQQIALEHLVDERKLTLPPSYGDDVASIEAQFADSGDDRDVLVETGTANAYVTAAAIAVGNAEYAADGDPAASTDAALQRGLVAAAAWLNDREVDLNPVLGISLTKQGLVPTDDDLSVPASDRAKAGIIAVDDAAANDKINALVATLPRDQVCGA